MTHERCEIYGANRRRRGDLLERRHRPRAGLAGAAGQPGGAVRGRRPGRHHRAHHGGAAERGPRPAGHHREHRRRRRHDRRGAGRQGGARRLHAAAVGQRRARHQPDPLQAAALQRGGRLRARGAVFGIGAGPDRAQGFAGRARCPSSSPTPRPTRPRCSTAPPAPARARMSAPSCSTSPWAPRSRTCPIAAPGRRCRT